MESNNQMSQKVGEIVVTDNSDFRSKSSFEARSNAAKSRSSTKRKVDPEKRAALMHTNMASSGSHILQDELA